MPSKGKTIKCPFCGNTMEAVYDGNYHGLPERKPVLYWECSGEECQFNPEGDARKTYDGLSNDCYEMLESLQSQLSAFATMTQEEFALWQLRQCKPLTPEELLELN